MPLPLYVVDAFTDRPFAGNPAAVCVLDRPREPAWMQAVAAEMNLSETAFLVRDGEAWQLRWFTPKVEVDLCGHATLASAHVLWETGRLPRTQAAAFDTRSGRLTCTSRAPWIEMDFPAEPPTDLGDPGDNLSAAGAGDRPATSGAGDRPATSGAGDLLGALHASGAVVGRKRNRMDYLVELADEQTVRSLKPDFADLAALPVRGVIVTARSQDPAFDFVSRFFAPAAGINEDPVTGSAHCCLGPYWGEKLGKTEMVAYQASARGGIVRITLRGPRVLLGGQAVTIFRAELAAD